MKKITVVLVFLLLSSIIFSAGKSESKDSATSGPITMKWAHTMQPTYPAHPAALGIAQDVAEKTRGAIKIEIFPAGQLGNAKDIIEASMRGSLDIIFEAASNLSSFYPKLSIYEMPFMFSSYDEFLKVYNSSFGKEMNEDFLSKMNLRILGAGGMGIRQITCNKPIRTLEDFKGLKIRVPEVQAPLQAFRALGASPTPIAFSELYFSLQTNVVEGQENPIVTIHAMKFYEVQKYLHFSNHQLSVLFFLMNENVWKKLNSDHKTIFSEAVKKHMAEYDRTIKGNESNLLNEMEKKGLQVIRYDAETQKAIKAKVETVYPNFENIWGQGALGKIKAAQSN